MAPPYDVIVTVQDRREELQRQILSLLQPSAAQLARWTARIDLEEATMLAVEPTAQERDVIRQSFRSVRWEFVDFWRDPQPPAPYYEDQRLSDKYAYALGARRQVAMARLYDISTERHAGWMAVERQVIDLAKQLVATSPRAEKLRRIAARAPLTTTGPDPRIEAKMAALEQQLRTNAGVNPQELGDRNLRLALYRERTRLEEQQIPREISAPTALATTALRALLSHVAAAVGTNIERVRFDGFDVWVRTAGDALEDRDLIHDWSKGLANVGPWINSEERLGVELIGTLRTGRHATLDHAFAQAYAATANRMFQGLNDADSVDHMLVQLRTPSRIANVPFVNSGSRVVTPLGIDNDRQEALKQQLVARDLWSRGDSRPRMLIFQPTKSEYPPLGRKSRYDRVLWIDPARTQTAVPLLLGYEVAGRDGEHWGFVQSERDPYSENIEFTPLEVAELTQRLTGVGLESMAQQLHHAAQVSARDVETRLRAVTRYDSGQTAAIEFGSPLEHLAPFVHDSFLVAQCGLSAAGFAAALQAARPGVHTSLLFGVLLEDGVATAVPHFQTAAAIDGRMQAYDATGVAPATVVRRAVRGPSMSWRGRWSRRSKAAPAPDDLTVPSVPAATAALGDRRSQEVLAAQAVADLTHAVDRIMGSGPHDRARKMAQLSPSDPVRRAYVATYIPPDPHGRFGVAASLRAWLQNAQTRRGRASTWKADELAELASAFDQVVATNPAPRPLPRTARFTGNG